MAQPSFANLAQMFNDGKLSELLKTKFSGKIGHQYPMKDSEVIISFPSPEKTPTAEAIRQAVNEHYTLLGYEVERGSMDSRNGPCFLMRHRSTSIPGFVSVIMTIPYPNDGHHNNLALNCEIHC